jgi:hypothetical protein
MPRQEKATETQQAASPDGGHDESRSGMSYLGFGAMIATSMVFMYGVMYLNTFELAHVRWSETRLFMTLLMGSTMAIIMLGFMLGMYKSRRVNIAIVAASLVLIGLGTWLVRNQTTVQETSYMSAMIPHHSIAILTSERSEIEDVRVCELAVEIIEAQRREIAEMEWLIEDIDQNGTAASAAQAEQRPVPEFEGSSSRTCP